MSIKNYIIFKKLSAGGKKKNTLPFGLREMLPRVLCEMKRDKYNMIERRINCQFKTATVKIKLEEV